MIRCMNNKCNCDPMKSMSMIVVTCDGDFGV